MLAVIVVLCIAAAFLIGGFMRLVVLRRQWREEKPPTYSRPYRKWKDGEDDDSSR
ncbi:MAG TPA: hypothetical protein VN193_08420 [Candidatus Angelobacter sp.]|jgi:hypothetical protein|nr:hypothetical protein [Candidatus Angelobacter sp.]